jgi:NAD(P)-dependent dehydrogenase (short-subunit alcohol dehydrogenase family)
MPNVLITGASRGLGLEFAKQYLEDGWRVFATCRQPQLAGDLQQLKGNIEIHSMDVTDSNQIRKLTEHIQQPIDVLINNAGKSGPFDERSTFGGLDQDTFVDLLNVNAFSPMKVTEAFIEHIKKSQKKMIVFISSRAGSVAERGALSHHQKGGNYIFRTSKAALNAMVQSLSFDLNPQGIRVLALHPGWVKTDNGGESADIDQETSVKGMRTVIENLKFNEKDVFRTYQGEKIAW